MHDYFLHKFVRMYFTKEKILRLAEDSFKDKYSRQELEKWLDVFMKRFFAQQYKRSAMPDGVRVGSVNLSPRADWRMPSDISPDAFNTKERNRQ